MIETISYGTQTIEFEIQRSKACKNTYISVERDAGVVVKTNSEISIEDIKVLVKSKAKWIMKKFEEIGDSVDYGKIVSGSRLFYMGKSYYIEIEKENRDDYQISFIHSKFKIKTPQVVNQDRLNETIDDFYKYKAKQKITKLVEKYSDIMKLYPEKLYFKKFDTKWASCSASNKISFNPEIMKLSASLIKYVVIHELAHIVHKNHSKDFWNLVKQYMSDYEKQEDILRGFEKRI
ncbi:MAG TPA: M48 family metallopeptidase [Aliarcobacter thereius]|nr:SprT family zinc-dependent metalloprotease [Aliarcobacter thereius]HJE03676.1 M48 family metallopeptidase [Aliarcobacter thereius]